MKTCPRCKTEKPVTEFYRKTKNKTGLASWCKSCDKRVSKECHRKRITGCSREKYEELRIAQDSRCAICRLYIENRELDTDHCHTTGRIRGLLCNKCNRGLGYVSDSVEYLQAMIDYLKKHGATDVHGDDLRPAE